MSNLKVASSLSPHGVLRVTKRFLNGSEEVIAEENLIVNSGRNRVLSSLYSASYSGGPLTALKVGVGGCIDPEGRFPKTPISTVTALYSSVLSLSISHSVSPTGDYVTFVADIDQSQCNGLKISEAGLFYGDGTMFNIKTFPGIPKSEEFGIHFEWTIRIY